MPEIDAPEDRHCTHLRDTGERCKGFKAKGSPFCAGHLGLGIAADPSAYATRGNQASLEVRQAKAIERKKSLRDRLQEDLEAHADEILAAYLAGIKTEGYRAAEAWLSRVYGKPEQHVVQEQAKTVEAMGLAELEEAKRQLLERGDNVTPIRKPAG